MYRDEESVAAEHAIEVQADLERLLAPRLAVARRLVPRLWHWFAALALFSPLVYCGSDLESQRASYRWANPGPSPGWQAAELTALATGLLTVLFFAAMNIAGRYRAGKILRRFGPPPSTMQASLRLAELQRRLLELRDLVEKEGNRHHAS